MKKQGTGEGRGAEGEKEGCGIAKEGGGGRSFTDKRNGERAGIECED